jgi:hypothetical protein
VKLNPPTFKTEPFAILKLAPAEATLTVTVNPPSIKALSPATGALAPGAPPEVADQVALTFQFPVATEYRSAAYIDNTEHNKATMREEIL